MFPQTFTYVPGWNGLCRFPPMKVQTLPSLVDQISVWTTEAIPKRSVSSSSHTSSIEGADVELLEFGDGDVWRGSRLSRLLHVKYGSSVAVTFVPLKNTGSKVQRINFKYHDQVINHKEKKDWGNSMDSRITPWHFLILVLVELCEIFCSAKFRY